MPDSNNDGTATISAGRARRRVKAVNYAKEQEFSDVDVFEDSADEAPAPTTTVSKRSRGRPRSSNKQQQSHASSSAGDVDEADDDFFKESKPIYSERGYDPSLPPMRERFTFLPEYEPDGSPRIELIVGRRPVDEKERKLQTDSDDQEDDDADQEDADEDEDDEEDESENDSNQEGDGRHQKRSRRKKRKQKKNSKRKNSDEPKETEEHVEYEYLVKYKGRSYLHLEWRTGADLESMNKSAKALYRRYLKKLSAGTDDDLEDPNFDASFAVPQKIVDEAEQEITVELTDKELLQWEKEREKALAEEDDMSDEEENGDRDREMNGEKEKVELAHEEKDKDKENGADKEENGEADKPEQDLKGDLVWEDDDELDFSKLTLERLRKIVNADGPYYQSFKGSDNPFRDGYITEPPKKPRASYLFFQCTMRSFFQKKNPNATQGELMMILGDTWRTMREEEQAPFIQLAREEAAQYDRERFLMEKAQRPNEVWQPLRRCAMVLDRIMKDEFSTIFLVPVNTNEFTDYEEVIDQPMDLGTVKTKLGSRKYQAPEQFARDVRKIWNNCKIYNQHGSAIWHVADYMSKVFERLYHAWVMEFRERYLRWVHPKARPWEPTCRQCDGKCSTPDDQMVLCDHCDALYGFKCLKPPLKKLPKAAWHCADCKPKLQSMKGIRMLSAVAEQAARKRAELGDTPKKRIRQTMYLVKWAGLGYEFSTWETKDDINDDALIAEYRRLNNACRDEPDMSEEVITKLLDNYKHIHTQNAGGVSCMPDIRSQLYAQTRALHFSKFGKTLPDRLCASCGPRTKSTVESRAGGTDYDDGVVGGPTGEIHPKEVVACVSGLVSAVAYRESLDPLEINENLPPLLTGEYDAVVPITSKGLMMNVGEIHGSVAFLGYRSFADGSKGPAELSNLIRCVGDKIIAVDGVSTVKKSFKEVIMMLRESGKNKFAYMRFLETKYSVCNSDLASVGNTGRFVVEELHKKFSADRQRLLVQRKQKLLETKMEEKAREKESDESVGPGGSDDESEDGSEGEFQPDSDDEVARRKNQGGDNSPGSAKGPTLMSGDAVTSRSLLANGGNEKKDFINGVKPESQGEEKKGPNVVSSSSPEWKSKENLNPNVLLRQETTRSLAYRLLDVDIGNSSDEGGDEECAYYFDGVDETFTTLEEAQKSIADTTLEQDKSDNRSKKNNYEEITVPIKRNDFSELGDRSKLAAGISLTTVPPCAEDFDNFPFPSSKEIEANKLKEEAEKNNEGGSVDSPQKALKRSTVKIEQISTATNEVIHVWASAESAAATLQLPLNEIKRVIRGDYDEDLGDEVGGFRWRYALAGAHVTAGTETSGRGKKAKEAWLQFRDKLYDPSEPHGYKNNNRLRDYQVDGVNWLASTYYKRHGCILADEMGLGKTVQIVCYIEHLYRVEKIHRPYLVVVPLSTVEHWRREFEGWTDMICCVYHDRQRIWRDVLREYEWYYADRPHTPDFLKFDVLVTTYDTLIGDFDVISQIPFRVAVVDEAHRLRNQKGKLLECMREISARGTMQYGFQSRVLMSGTPLQNDLNELWTLLNFIEPFKFPDLDDFQKNFGNMSNRSQVEALQQIISPFMLRRVKEDVAKDIPAKEETVIDVELTSIQKQYYRAIFEHNHAFLSMGATRSNAPKLMNIQMELRKVCNHPFLLDGVEHRETDRQYKEFMESGKFEGKTPEEQQHMLNEHGYIMTSGKMVLLDKLLPKLRQEGHKVLIFSQMVKMLDFISEYCEFQGFPYERLDGRVRGTERQKAIDRFEREENSFIFLLSTRAGGVGINLTAADICIIFDSDWNPQNDVQAQARCHRIGQTRDVRIYRLITSRTFEQEMFDRASKKLGLEQAVLGTFGQDNEDDKPTNKEMEQLLKKGAYALLEDENDESGKAFCADDIENILAKRTRTRVVEGTKTASWLNKQGMVVSKSKFTSDNATAALDMDDPLFWQKVMPDFVTPSIMLQKLSDLSDNIIGTPTKPKKRGRGRGRKKKSETEQPEENREEPVVEQREKTEEAEDGKEGGDGEADDSDAKFQLTRTNQRKVHKFMSDLMSMMEGIFDEADDDTLPAIEKSTCQNLLLTISINEKLFSEQQRSAAKRMLKRLEGDRRRRCRTADQGSRFSPGKAMREVDDAGTVIPEELRIVGRKRRRKRRNKDKPSEQEQKRKTRKSDEDEDVGEYIGDDGYLHHSDSEADWSDIAEELYPSTKKNVVSRKEAKRRRQWAADDDAATAAGRPWPVFPRNVVAKVLKTVLEEVMKNDDAKGGLFSEPVSEEDFPEYYEQIKQPMDYGTMKEKLDRGEYRSAQAMQKDFILVMQNCLQFNSPDSDIVKEARQQALMRPSILRNAAVQNNLFLAEDGSVLEILDEEKKKEGEEKRRRRRKGSENVEDEAGPDDVPIPRKRKGRPKKSDDMEEGEIEDDSATEDENVDDGDGDDNTRDNSNEANQSAVKSKPRIRIRVGQNGTDKESESHADKEKKPKKRGPKRNNAASQEDDGSEGVRASKRKKVMTQDGEDFGRASKRKKVVSQDENDRVSLARRKKQGKKGSLKEEEVVPGKRKKSITRNEVDGSKTGKRKRESSVEEESRMRSGKRKKAGFQVEDDGIRSRRKKGFNLDEDDNDKSVRLKKVVSHVEVNEDIIADDGELISIPKKKRRNLPTAVNTIGKRNERTKRRRNKLPLSEDRGVSGEVDNVCNPVNEVVESDGPVVESDEQVVSPDHETDDAETDLEKTEDEEEESVYLDMGLWQKEREALDGTFAAARVFFTKRGPWILPNEISDRKFGIIAKATLAKMDRHDKFQVFTEAVSESEAPGYGEIVKYPMDFGTMRDKVENKEYGTGSDAAGRLYRDFLLVFDNCRLYNDEEGEVIEEAARLLALLPEAYVAACVAVAKQIQK